MILDKFRLDGKTAVVTGGTKGIGKAIAIALAEAGADIAVVSRSPQPNIEKVILGLGRGYMHHAADLAEREQTRNVIPAIVKRMGDVDILVNNAGIIRRSPAAEHSEGDWDSTLETDLTAPFILCQAAGRIMLKKGKGKIINIASVLAFQGGINVTAYASAKHGVVGLTKAFANDWASKGINVNALAPSFFTTELTEAIQKDPERSQSITARTPAGRWGTPDDIAAAA
ncbi:MAG: SDR family NAD(P)-dependent oxidoreductase, partial [Deltaproteobacteria bacterium]|nr:SDR family NAD(P)-dependent oxidoreductase [Deltaproteobacteria bacterium]